MNKKKFVRDTTITFGSRLFSLLVGIGTSVVLARALGPQGRGTYALAMLLPNMIVTFGNFGVGPATVYYVARGKISREIILGNNILLSLILSAFGILAGVCVIIFFHQNLFKGVAVSLLILSLALVPLNFFLSFVKYILLGAQRIKEFNYIGVIQTLFFFTAVVLALLFFRVGIAGAIGAAALSTLAAGILAFHWAKMVSGGVKLRPYPPYIKKALIYGFQSHLSNILGFLNYRADVFLINWFLSPAAVGLYSVSVGLAEKIWLVSQSAGTVLFPKIAAENEEELRKTFTPFVARTVLWLTALGAIVLFLISKQVILLLYSDAFLPAVSPLQGLVVGIIALAPSRVLANDIAGRGRPALNAYRGLITVFINITLNLLWIPRYGIVGSAWASTVAYTASFIGALLIYCHLSGNPWTVVLLPQPEDWVLYKRIVRGFKYKLPLLHK